MKRIKTWIAAHTVLAAIIGSLVIAGTAAASWIIYTGATGVASGQQFAVATTNTAVTLANDAPKVNQFSGLAPGGTESTYALITNNTVPAVAESITGGSAVFASTPSDCASHLSLNPAAFPIAVPATDSSTEHLLSNFIKADATLPNDCSGGSWTITSMNLTTNP